MLPSVSSSCSPDMINIANSILVSSTVDMSSSIILINIHRLYQCHQAGNTPTSNVNMTCPGFAARAVLFSQERKKGKLTRKRSKTKGRLINRKHERPRVTLIKCRVDFCALHNIFRFLPEVCSLCHL